MHNVYFYMDGYIEKYMTLGWRPFVPRLSWHHPYYYRDPSTWLEQLAEAFKTPQMHYVYFYIDITLANISHWIGVHLC
jgi:hypothetical protein